MTNILKLNKISSLADKVFPEGYVMKDSIENPVGIMLRSFKMHDYEIPESVLCVARAGAGVNNIPLDKCAEKGIVVFNTPGANSNAVKELVICSMLLCGRKIVDSINWTKNLTGEDIGKQVEDGKKAFIGGEILGKTLVVVGMGAIGLKVANASAALGMNVIAFDSHLNDQKKAKLSAGITVMTDLQEALNRADFISLHVPYVDSTKYMINAKSLSTMKDGVIIINCARGELVNNDDIKAALKSGKVAKYVTDFPSAEVIGVENIIATPHIGASTPEAEDNCAVMAAEEMVDYIENGNIRNSVNYPALSKERNGKRLCVLYKAEADAKVKEILSSDAVTAVKGNYGYAILDFTDCKCKCVEALNAIPEVLKVRKLA